MPSTFQLYGHDDWSSPDEGSGPSECCTCCGSCCCNCSTAQDDAAATPSDTPPPILNMDRNHQEQHTATAATALLPQGGSNQSDYRGSAGETTLGRPGSENKAVEAAVVLGPATEAGETKVGTVEQNAVVEAVIVPAWETTEAIIHPETSQLNNGSGHRVGEIDQSTSESGYSDEGASKQYSAHDSSSESDLSTVSQNSDFNSDESKEDHSDFSDSDSDSDDDNDSKQQNQEQGTLNYVFNTVSLGLGYLYSFFPVGDNTNADDDSDFDDSDSEEHRYQ